TARFHTNTGYAGQRGDMVILLSFLLLLGGAQAAAQSDGALSGQVVADGTNTPIADARVFVFPAGPIVRPIGPPPQTVTDTQGRFTLTHLAAGRYRIDVQKTGFARLNEMGAPGPTVDVAAGQTATVQLHLQKGAVIAGRVLDASGEPMPDV